MSVEKNMRAKYRIVGLGEILWDVYPEAKYLGGAPANFAIHAQQLGNQGIVVSRIGNDRLGQEILQELNRRGLETKYLQIDDEKKTGTVEVKLGEQGVPSFRCSEDVAFDYLRFTEDLSQLAQEADAILFGSLAQRNPVSRQAIQTFLARATRAFKLYDVNIRGWNAEVQKVVEQSLELADAFKLNEEELQTLRQAFGIKHTHREEFIRNLMESYQLKLVALTMGEKGCFLLDRDNIAYSPGIKITPIDTTGSGDAFAAALVTKYLEGSSLKEMAEFSNQLGAYVATQKGAAPFYELESVKAFLLLSGCFEPGHFLEFKESSSVLLLG
ncbi:MAG: carbohydrate kinase [candidate division KSB1 bacterium]|nr:carbohydrate kinase [candidate division KSB1 bacterium]